MFTWVHLGFLKFPWVPFGSLGFTWVHLGQSGLIWDTLEKMGPKLGKSHKQTEDSQDGYGEKDDDVIGAYGENDDDVSGGYGDMAYEVSDNIDSVTETINVQDWWLPPLLPHPGDPQSRQVNHKYSQTILGRIVYKTLQQNISQ